MSIAPGDVEIFYLDDMEDEIIITEMNLRRQKLTLDVQFFMDETDMLRALDRRRETAATLPGLIVTDLNMPGKGGLHLVKSLRADAVFEGVVIGVCTGSENPADRAAALGAGADFFAVKPFDAGTIRQICETTARFELIEQDDGRSRLGFAATPVEAA